MDKLISGDPDIDSEDATKVRSSRHATSVDDKLVNLLEDIDDENDIRFVVHDIQQQLTQL